MCVQLWALSLWWWALPVATAYKVEVVVSGGVKGAHVPIDQYGSECTVEQFSNAPCTCDGGASRRAAAIAKRRKEAAAEGIEGVVALDIGASFFGSGLSFPTFSGSAGAALMAKQGYDARTLSASDFAAGVSDEDPTGGKLLAEYLAASASVGPAIVSNIDFSGDPYLDNKTLVDDLLVFTPAPGIKAGVINIIDKGEMDKISPYYAERVQNRERSLSTIVSSFRDDIFNLPDILIVVMSGMSQETIDDLLSDTDDTLLEEEDDAARTVEALFQFALRFVLVDVVLVDGTSSLGRLMDGQEFTGLTNWGGDPAAAISSDSATCGVTLTNMTLEFDSLGNMVFENSSRGIIPLDCAGPEDSEVFEDLIALKETIDTINDDPVLGHVGYVASEVDSTWLIPDRGCSTIEEKGGSFCGCSVAECEAGNLVADAIAWFTGADVAFVAAGALGKSLSPDQVRKSHVLDLVPDIGDEIVKFESVSGATIRELLQRSLNRLIEEGHDLEAGRDQSGGTDPLYQGSFFLQVSSSLRFSWFFLSGTPTIESTIFLNGVPIESQQTYSVAGSSRLFKSRVTGTSAEDAVASIYMDLFNDIDEDLVISTGHQHFQIVSEYLLEFHGTAETALDPDLEYMIPGASDRNSTALSRIWQTGDLQVVHVAVLCGDSISRREQCDHALHAVDVLNNHNDGILDDVMPSIRLVAHDVTVGCVEGKAFDGLVEIAHLIEPDPLSAVILTCSDDVVSVASTEAISRFENLTGQTEPYVVVSPSATAPTLSDQNLFPYFVRLATSESEIGVAVSHMVNGFTWRDVLIVHDDSLWGTSSAQAFIDRFYYESADHSILGGGRCVKRGVASCLRSASVELLSDSEDTVRTTKAVGISFSLDGFDDGLITGLDIINEIADVGASVVFIATYPRVQRSIFAASRTTNTNFGTGFAWLTNLPSEDTFLDENGDVNFDAVVGHQGSLGFLEHTPTEEEGDVFAAYIASWASYASTDACLDRSIAPGISYEFTRDENGNGNLTIWGEGDTIRDTVDGSYCDVDGISTTLSGYSAFWADAVVILARGLGEIAEKQDGGTFSTSADIKAQDLFDEMVALENFNGTSGLVAIAANGDRLGRLDLVNMQVVQEGDFRRKRRLLHRVDRPSEDSQKLVELASSFADFVTVGDYRVATEAYKLDEDALLFFPGGTTEVPLDTVDGEAPENGRTDDDNSGRYRRELLLTLFIALAAFIWMLALVCAIAGYVFRLQDFHHRRAMVASLRAFEVIQPFDPDRDQERTVHILEKRGNEDIFGQGSDMLITSVERRNDGSAPYTRIPFTTAEDIEPPQADPVTLLGENNTSNDNVDSRHLFHLELWWWEEDSERLRTQASEDELKVEKDSPDDPETLPPRAWVVYDELVQDQLSETYWRFQQLPEAVRLELRKEGLEDGDELTPVAKKLVADVPQSDYIVVIQPTSSTTGEGDDGKAVTTGNNNKWIEINIATMRQRNLKTGRYRNVRMDSEAREVKLTWYWRENLRNMAKWRHDESATRNGTLWVKYEDANVQRRLSEAYLSRRRSRTADPVVKLDSYNELTSHKSEVKYEVDVSTMWQTKTETQFRRPICVIMETIRESTDVRYADGRAVAGSAVVRGVPTVKGMPEDIQGRMCLPLTTGMLVSVVYEHDGGDWAFGREIRNRNEVLENAGWFPMACVKECEEDISLVPETAALRDFKFLLPPKNWTMIDEQTQTGHLGSHDGRQLVPLGMNRVSAKERAEVLQAFDTNYYDIVSVERVQNVALWRPYATKRMTVLEREGYVPDYRLLKDSNGIDSKVELFPVYHGTTAVNAAKIIEQGFNRDFCSTSAQHGRGVYFSTNADYSAFPKYAPPDKDGIQRVFVCRIIVGRYTKGSPDFRVAPPLENNPNQRYDTTVDTLINPSIYVTYSDHSSYPAYLVKFKASHAAREIANDATDV